MSTFINELPQYQNQIIETLPSSSGQGMNPNIVNQLINEINEASMKGETALPPRDIPTNIQIDEQSIPNYVPSEGEKFAQGNVNEKQMIHDYNRKVTRDEKFDKIYDEIQVPLLLSILYFLFQLPIFKNFMFKIFPFMFSKDGNSNIHGYFGFSLLFGIFYYVINKAMLIINF
jgi:hypothetical protein